jgi:DNA repair protein RecN (Recombination protein N)
MDLLRYEINEIQSASVKTGEEEALKEELNAALNAEKIAEALRECHLALYGRSDSMLSELKRITRNLESISGYSSGYAALSERLNESYYNLEDIAQEAQRECDRVSFDENRITQIQERLDLLFTLKRKYGGSEESVLAYLEEASNKLERLENSDKLLFEILNKIGAVQRKLYELCGQLSGKRMEVGRKLEDLIQTELKDLGMSTSRFKIRFENLPAFEDAQYNENGLDKVEFTISTNIGEPLKPLAKIVSGGEVSRIMLAFKNVLARTDRIGTLIFDEIDTGISGNMARVVAEKLARIALAHQVICVTHTAQIAAMGAHHFFIEKTSDGTSTQTHVTPLDSASRVEEVGRLVGGDVSSLSRGHAREMLEWSRKFKEGLR